MNISPLEAQLIASSIIAVPGIILLLFAVFTGHFKRNEEAKWVVLLEEEEDYWDQSSPASKKTTPPNGSPAPKKEGGRP
jgi:hypothetical protein